MASKAKDSGEDLQLHQNNLNQPNLPRTEGATNSHTDPPTTTAAVSSNDHDGSVSSAVASVIKTVADNLHQNCPDVACSYKKTQTTATTTTTTTASHRQDNNERRESKGASPSPVGRKRKRADPNANCSNNAAINQQESVKNDFLSKLIKAIKRNPDVAAGTDLLDTTAPTLSNLLPTPSTATPNYKKSHNESHSVDAADGSFTTYYDKEKEILGCIHYRRSCRLKAACCGKLYTCRICHDENEDHPIDRHATKEMQCMHCGQIQPTGSVCVGIGCGKKLAHYYCDACKFWDDSPGKSVYHCPHCNMCRVGKGLGIDFFHCMKCNACMSLGLQNNHRCMERSLDSNCPICLDGTMFTSTIPVVSLQCGHCMHEPCFRQYLKTNYTCPICQKSLGDMSDRFRQLDHLISSRPMPEQYQGVLADILCNDCEKRSTVTFHMIGIKCEHCGSYNTKRT